MTKISELTQLAAIDVDSANDIIPIVDTSAGETKYVTVIDVAPFNQVGDAYIGGDQTGNTRGTEAIDIQSSRTNVSQVASGANSIAIGTDVTASGTDSIAIGNTTTASGTNSVVIGDATCIGNDTIVIGDGASSPSFDYESVIIGVNARTTDFSTRGVAIGYSAQAQGDLSTAIGHTAGSWGSHSTALGAFSFNSGLGSVTIGKFAKTTRNQTVEIATWTNATTRLCGLRIHPDGMCSFTVRNHTAKHDDGGTTDGDEAINTLPRDMWCLRRNGLEFFLEYNDGGTVRTLLLGTVS